jgi:hypothetical protein
VCLIYRSVFRRISIQSRFSNYFIFIFFVTVFPPFERLEINLMKYNENICPRRDDDDDNDSKRSQNYHRRNDVDRSKPRS